MPGWAYLDRERLIRTVHPLLSRHRAVGYPRNRGPPREEAGPVSPKCSKNIAIRKRCYPELPVLLLLLLLLLLMMMLLMMMMMMCCSRANSGRQPAPPFPAVSRGGR
jgi:hypothetical protein